jgi:MerR family transcriptional regulator, heat shock protein HspR
LVRINQTDYGSQAFKEDCRLTTQEEALISFGNKDLAKYTMAVTVMMTGVAAHKIRRLEEYGLCKPARTCSKQRLYSDDDIDRIRQIAYLEKDGVNLPGVKLILEMQKSLPERPKEMNL